jgi:hypothetical protein
MGERKRGRRKGETNKKSEKPENQGQCLDLLRAAPVVLAMNHKLQIALLKTGLFDRFVNHSPSLLPGMPASKTARNTTPTVCCVFVWKGDRVCGK